MIGRRHSKAAVDEENPYWMSFSDVMSGLLLIFILAAIVLIMQLLERQQEYDETVKRLQQAEAVRQTILEEARDELQAAGIPVQISENYTVLRIPNHLLGFETAEFELNPQYEDKALKIGEVLHRVITKDNRIQYLDTVFVEGHTDNRAYNGLLGTGNWGLSTFRAISLWQFWDTRLSEESKLAVLTNPDNSSLFSVSGYGDMRPATEQQITEEDLRANRRIDIRFTIRRPTSQEYEQELEKLQQGEI